MAKTHTILEVFIASPGDVAPERSVLEDVVSEFNLTWGDKHKVRLDLVKWETHSRPAFGEDGQDVINEQVGDTYDISLGSCGDVSAQQRPGPILEHKKSSTERMRDCAAETTFRSCSISRTLESPPSQMDGEQLLKVQAFKKKIADEYGGLYYQFETTDDFQTRARIHLSKVVQDWLDSNAGTIESKTVTKTEDSETVKHNPLANLAALDDGDADDGLIDLIDRWSGAMDEVVLIVNRMGEATNDSGAKFDQRTEEVNRLTAGGGNADLKSAKRVSNNAANDLDVFVKRMSVEIPEFYNQNSVFMESFGKVAMLSEQDFDDDADDVKAALASMQEYRGAITDCINSIQRC